MNEVKIMSVFNPYDDKHEDLVCTFMVITDKKGGLKHLSLESIVSESGIELLDYLEEMEIPYSLEKKFKEEWK